MIEDIYDEVSLDNTYKSVELEIKVVGDVKVDESTYYTGKYHFTYYDYDCWFTAFQITCLL